MNRTRGGAVWLAVIVVAVLSGCATNKVVQPPPPPEPVQTAESVESIVRAAESAVAARMSAPPVPPPSPTFQPSMRAARPDERPCRPAPEKPFPVELFYGTSRGRSNSRAPESVYTVEDRGDLEVGQCVVTIPPAHVCGQVEAPNFFVRATFGVDRMKHLVLREVVPLDRDLWSLMLNLRLRVSGRNEAFVYVHGFNTTFEQAAQRTAQLHYDMSYPGVPMFFSWPSWGGPEGLGFYFRDQGRTDSAGRQLRRFLDFVAAESDVKAIHVIVHSMGNLVFAKSMRNPGDGRPRPYNWATTQLQEVVLTAADLGEPEMRQLARTLRASKAGRVTLYASREDVALKASRVANFRKPVGLATTPLFVDTGIETIDASVLDTDWISHAYTAGNALSIWDLRTLMLHRWAPMMRGLVAIGPNVWRFEFPR